MKTFIVLLAVDVFDRHGHADRIENMTFIDSADMKKFLSEGIDADITGDVLWYELTEFMEECNGQMLELELWWVSYVNLEN